MAIAGRRRVPAGFTNVTYRTVGPIASIASQPELTVFRPEQPCLPFLPTRTMTSAGMRSAPRYHLAYRTGCAAPNCCTRSREPARPLVFGCLGPIPSVLLGDCRRSSEDSPLITDHCLTTVHIVTRHAVKSMGMFIRNVHQECSFFLIFVFIACTIVSKHARLLYRRYCTSGSGAAPVWAGERIIEE